MHQDSWAIKAQQEGHRSRAVYKLMEIDKKFSLIQKDDIILDIGAAPGGWSEYISIKYPNIQIFALDILPIDPIQNVTFFQQDLRDINDNKTLTSFKGSFSLVISDLAPNISGISLVDESNVLELNLLTLEIADSYLSDSMSRFIIKTFQNSNMKFFRSKMEKIFSLVQTCKPAASKKTSAEIYLYGER
tara:strand:+ start:7173 stop:7739 length:567 start_codon:yes stop_codon:yes gene_type:complete